MALSFPGWASPRSVVVLEQSKLEGWTRSPGDLCPTSPVWVAVSNKYASGMYVEEAFRTTEVSVPIPAWVSQAVPW